MTIARKLWLGFGLLILIFLLAGLIIFLSQRSIQSILDHIAGVDEPTRAAAYEMEINATEIGRSVLEYVNTGDPRYRERFAQDRADFERFKARYDELADTHEGVERGERIDAIYGEYVALGEDLMDSSEGPGSAERLRPELGRFAQIEDELDRVLDDEIQPSTEQHFAEAQEAANDAIRRVYWTIGSLLVLGLLVGALAAYLISRGIIGSVRRLSEGAERVGRGELGHRIDLDSSDELGAVAAAFNGMLDRRREANAALQESEERLRGLSEATFEGVAISESGKILETNKAFTEMFGRGRREVVGRDVLDFLAPESHEVASRSLAATSAEPYEAVGLRKDGTQFDVEIRNKTSRYRDRLVHVIAVRDVTERKRAEERLRQAEARYRTVVDQIPAITYQQEVEHGGAAYFVSPQVEDILGYTPEEYSANPGLWVDILHPDDREHVLAEDARTDETGEPFKVEYRMSARDGRTVWVRDEAVLVRDEDGNPLFWQGFMLEITEEREAGLKLRTAEARYRSLVENIPVVVYTQEPGEPSLTTYISPQIEVMQGYSQQEVMADGDHWAKTLHPEDRERVLAEDARTNRTGEPFIEEYRQRTKDGEWVWVHDEAVLVHDEEGEALFWQGVLLDITEQKVAESRLREAESRYRSLVENIPVIVYTHQASDPWLTTYVSPQIEKTLGYTPEEVLADPEHFVKTLHPDDRERVLALDEQTNQTGEPFVTEYRQLAKDGSVVWFRNEAVLVRDDEGRPLFWQGVKVNITERKKAELAVRENERRFRQLFDQSVDALMIHDAAGKIVDCNAEACRSLGYSREELLSLRVRDIASGLVNSDDTRSSTEPTIWQRALAGEPGTVAGIHRGEHRRKDGTTFPVEVYVGSVDYGEQRLIFASVRDITERMEAEEALRASEERFRLVAGATNEVIWDHDLATNAQMWDGAVEAMFGYSPEEIGDDAGWWEERVHPEDRERVIASTQAVLRDGQNTWFDEYRFRRADGTYATVADRARVLRDEEGEPSRMVGSMMDVTERRRAEDELRESEERYRTLVETLQEGIAYIGPEGGEIAYCNEAYAEVLGLTPEELVGRSFFEFLDEEQKEKALAEREQRLLGIGSSYEISVIAADGSRKDLSATGSPIFDADGSYRGAVQTIVDVTESRRAERELRKSQASLAEAQRMAHIGNWEYDLTTEQISWSDEVFRIYGYAPQEYIPTLEKLLEIVHPDDRHLIRERMDGALYRGEPYDFEHRIVLPDGTERCVHRRARVEFDEEGRPLRMIGTIQDITERRLAEKEREKQARHAALRADVGAALSGSGTLSGVLQQCADAVVHRLDAAFARVWTLNEEEDVLELQASAGLYTHTDGAHSRVPVGELKVGLIAQEREPHLINTLTSDPRISDKEWARREGMVAFAGYPLVVEEKLVGVVAMFSYEELDEDVLEALGSLANMLAQGIKRKRVEEEIRELNESLERRVEERTAELELSLERHGRSIVREQTLRSASAALAAAQDRERVYAAALEAVLPFIDEAQGTRVSIWSGTSDKDLCVGAAGDDAAGIEGKETFIRNFPDWVREPLLEGRAVELRPGDAAKVSDAFGFQTKLGAIFMIPLLVGGQFRGRIVVASDSTLPEEIKYALETLGSQVALALIRADLIEDLQQRTGQLEEAIARLMESEERYSLVVEGSNDGIYDWDIVGDTIFWNDRLFEIVGLPPSAFEPTLDVFLELVHPDDRERVSENITAHLEHGEEFNVEYGMRHASGEYRTCITRGKAQRDENGRPFRMAGTVTDITDRKRAEEALRLLAEASAELSSSLDRRATLASVAHLAVPQLADWCAVDILAEDGSLERLAIAHQDPEKIELARQLQERYPAAPDAPGGVYSVLRSGRSAFYPEISEEMIQAIARDEEHLRIIREVGFTSAIIVPIAARGKTYGAITLVSAESGRPYVEADLRLAEDLAQRIASAVENARLYEEAQRELAERKRAEEEIRRLNETLESRVEERTAQLRNAITELEWAGENLRRAKEEAESANRAKSDFLANMSHEIRTPMNGVIGMTELLLDSPLDAEQREYAETIRISGESLLSVINDILDFSKIEAGEMRLETINFDLRTAVEDVVVALFAERAYEKDLELASLVDYDVPTALEGDPGRIRQILTNLVGNAIKFTEKGEVVLRAELVEEKAEEATVRISVRDTGIGLSAEQQDLIFESFVQADASTTRRYGGTGLGLTISRQLVELMGGEIGVESEPGVGSTFFFALPLKKQPGGRRSPGPRADLSGIRVLVVDDSPANRQILNKQLSSWGVESSEVEDGFAALEELRSAAEKGEPYDLAILDMQMPGMDGIELARAIREDSDLSRTRLVLLTSVGQRGDGEEARRAGIEAYLTKPVRQAELHDALVTVMGIPKESDAEAAPLITRHTLRERQTGTRVHLLLAEDNPVNQAVAARSLEKLGYRVDVAGNGREALEALSRKRYAAVLMDVQMPEMDGYEATIEIRHREAGQGEGRRIPIIAMTANAMQGDREKVLAAGMDDYLPKPVRQEELDEVLTRWLPEAAARKEDEPSGEPPPPPAAGNGSDRPLDPEVVAGLRELGDAELLAELAEMFFGDASSRLAQLREALEEDDAHTLERVAHTLKGSSGNIGATRMAAICAELQDVGASGDLLRAPELVERLEEELGRVRPALEEELEKDRRS